MGGSSDGVRFLEEKILQGQLVWGCRSECAFLRNPTEIDKLPSNLVRCRVTPHPRTLARSRVYRHPRKNAVSSINSAAKDPIGVEEADAPYKYIQGRLFSSTVTTTKNVIYHMKNERTFRKHG